MRVRAVLLAAALVLAPLGARAADLVVWWPKGFYAEEDQALRELVATFEQKSGKRVELDPLAALLLKGGDQLPERLVLLSVESLGPPDDEVGGAGAERRQDERGGEEDGPDPHGAAP